LLASVPPGTSRLQGRQGSHNTIGSECCIVNSHGGVTQINMGMVLHLPSYDADGVLLSTEKKDRTFEYERRKPADQRLVRSIARARFGKLIGRENRQPFVLITCCNNF
jgi:hypothetical protein